MDTKAYHVTHFYQGNRPHEFAFTKQKETKESARLGAWICHKLLSVAISCENKNALLKKKWFNGMNLKLKVSKKINQLVF